MLIEATNYSLLITVDGHFLRSFFYVWMKKKENRDFLTLQYISVYENTIFRLVISLSFQEGQRNIWICVHFVNYVLCVNCFGVFGSLGFN